MSRARYVYGLNSVQVGETNGFRVLNEIRTAIYKLTAVLLFIVLSDLCDVPDLLCVMVHCLLYQTGNYSCKFGCVNCWGFRCRVADQTGQSDAEGNVLFVSSYLISHLETGICFVLPHAPVFPYLKINEAIGGWRKLRNAEIYNLYIPQNTIRTVRNPCRLCQKKHTQQAYGGGVRNPYKSLVVKPEQKIPVHRLTRGRKHDIGTNRKGKGVRLWIGSNWHRIEPMNVVMNFVPNDKRNSSIS
jgi:hypothetical protein